MADIENSNSNTLISGTTGADIITNTGSSVTVNAGAGNDSVSNTDGSLISINGGDGDDSIKNSNGTRITIRGGTGNDFVSYDAANQQSFHYIDGGADNDTVESFGEHATVVGGDGDDKISHGGIYSSLVGGAGNDTVENWEGGYSTIDGGEGDDYLRATAHSSVKGGDGNDSIFNDSDHNTLDGGAGHDSINNYGRTASNTYINAGDGNDSIKNDGADNITINAGAGDDSIHNWGGWHMTIDAGAGHDTIDNYALDRVNETTGETDYASDYYINGGDGDDSIRGGAKDITIIGGTGNDTVDAWGSSNATINVSVDDDYVEGKMQNSTVVGGDGNDTLKISGSKNIIDGGKGDNHIHSWSANGSIKTEDGDDYIYNWGDAANSTINSGDGNDSIINEGANVLLNAGAGNDSVEGEMQNSTVYGGAGNDTIESNTDSYDGDTPKAHDNYLDGGDDDDFIKTWHGSNFTMLGGKGNDTIRSEGKADTNYGKNNYIDAGEGDDSIVNAFAADNATLLGGAGNDFIAAEASDNNIVNGGSGDDYLRHTGWWDFDNHSIKGTQNTSLDGGDGSDTILNECGSNATIQGGKGNDSIYCTAAWMDGDPMTAPNNNIVDGGDDNDTINNYGGSKVTLKGGNDIIKNENARVNGYGDTVFVADKVSIEGGAGNDTIRNNAENVTIYGGDGDDIIDNYWDASLTAIDGGNGNDTIENTNEKVTISGGAGNDSIKNTGANSTVNAGAGNDTIIANGWREGITTLNAGAGNDLIKINGRNQLIEYANGEGNDTVYGLNANSTLKITGGSISSASVNGVDVLLKVGSGSILLKNVVGNSVNIINGSNSVNETIFGNADILYGTENDDILENDRNGRLIKPLGGNDIVSLKGSKQIIDYGGGRDIIYGIGDNDTVRNDYDPIGYIYGNDIFWQNTWAEEEGKEGLILVKDGVGKKYSMMSTDGRLFVSPEGLTLPSGSDVEDIISSSSNIVIDIGNNSSKNIWVDGDYVTVKAYGTNNRIGFSYDNNKVILTGDYADNIDKPVGEDGTSFNISVNAGGGNDYIGMQKTVYFTLNGGAGNDYVDTRWSTVYDGVIDGGAGNDAIVVDGLNNSVNGGDGDDSIDVNNAYTDEELDYTEFSTVVGGKGNDTVWLYANTLYQYANGDGNDTIIYQYAEDIPDIEDGDSFHVIQITNGTVSNVSLNGDDVVIKVGTGSLTIKNVEWGDPLDNLVVKDQNHIFKLQRSEDGSSVETLPVDSINDGNTKVNYADNVVINGGEHVYNLFGSDVEIRSAEEIFNYGANAVLNGGMVRNVGANAVITAATGGHISNEGLNATLNVNGTAFNVASGASINGSNKNDTIENIGGNAKIEAGAGDDSILHGARTYETWEWVEESEEEQEVTKIIPFKDRAANATINGGAGNDTVDNYADNVSIEGDAGNDVINNYASNVTMRGGDGADTLTLNYLTDRGEVPISAPKNNVVEGGAGNDLLDNEGGSNITLDGGDGNDTIYSNSEYYLQYYSDQPILSADNVSINGGDGDDSIRNWNAGENYTVSGGAGNDSIENISENALIDGGDDDDYIENAGLGVTIEGGDGNDTIEHSGNESWDYDGSISFLSDASINGGAGNDSIVLRDGLGVTFKDIELIAHEIDLKAVVDAGEGDDTIEVRKYGADYNATVYGGAGNDYIKNESSNVSVNGGAGDDSILNESTNEYYSSLDGNNVTVDAGEGNDYIENHGIKVTLFGGDGNDTIDHWGNESYDNESISFLSDATINGGAGNDSIVLRDGLEIVFAEVESLEEIEPSLEIDLKAVVDAGEGDDTIEVRKHLADYNATVYGGAGNDFIKNESDNVSVDGGAGDDSIQNSGQATINGGAGNDYIHSEDGSAILNGGDGADHIINNGEGATVNGGAGNDFIENFEAFATAMLYGGDGNDTITNSGTQSTVEGGAGNDYIVNDGENATIDGGAGNDTIKNERSNASINGGAGNDSIYNEGGEETSQSINGGAGNDTIRTESDGATLNGGADNDLIILQYGSDNVVEYVNGDGNDTVIGAIHKNTLKITNGNISSASVNGADVLLRVGNGSVLLKNAAGRKLNLINGGSSVTETVFGNTIRGTEDADTLNVDQNKMIVQPLVGNDIVSLSGSTNVVDFEGGHDIVHGLKDNDVVRIEQDPEIYSGLAGSLTANGNDLIFFKPQDDGLGLDNVADAVESGEYYSLTLKDAADKNLKILQNTSLYYTPAVKSDVLNDVGVTDIHNFFDGANIDIGNSTKIIYNYADNVNIKSDGDVNINGEYDDHVVKNVVVQTGNGNNYINLVKEEPVASYSNIKISAGSGNDGIELDKADLVQAYGGDGDDYFTVRKVTNGIINGGKGNDELRIKNSNGIVIQYEDGDGNDTVYGFDKNSKNEELKLRIKGNYETVESGNDVIVTVGSGSILLKDAANVELDIDKLSKDDTLLAGIEYDPKKPSKLIVKDPFTGLADASAYSESITMIDASQSTKPVILKAGQKATVINAGKGESTLIGGPNADKYYGGEGVNVFVYTVGEGKDVVYDYEAQDLISIVGATRDQMTFNDKKDAVTITFSNNKASLTINKVNTTDALTIDIGGETFKYGELPSGVTFDSNDKKTGLNVGADAADGVTVDAINIVSTAKTLDASKASKSVYMLGNGNKNTLTAGKGGSTLYGGKYNAADKLIGGDGADVFIYSTGDGADVISNFDGSKGDYILLNGVTALDPSNVNVSANKILVTVGNQKLTLDDPQGAVNFVNDSGVTLYTVGINFPAGVGYNAKKTAVTVGADASNVGTIDLSSSAYLPTVKEVDAKAYNGAIEIIGNGQANVLYASKGGSTMDGGAGNDKYHGGDGSDTFVYDGQGGDVIYDFDGTKDVVMLKGLTSIDPKNINVSANKIVVTINGQKLTLDNPQGEVRFVNDSNTELYTVGINFPKGMDYNAKKTAVTVGAEASNVGTIDLSSSAYLPTVKEVDSTDYNGALEIIGNGQANVLYASKGGSTLDGGAGADKYYGSEGSDTFVYDGDGGDVIYDFDGTKDVVMLKGLTALDPSNVNVSANKIIVTINGQKLTLDNPQGEVRFINDSDTELYSVGINFAKGVGYNAKKTAVTIGADASNVGTIDLSSSAYLPMVKEVDAKDYNGTLEIIGNGQANVLYAGKGAATLNGGYNVDKNKATADKLYGSTVGADVFVWDASTGGGDQIYNYSAAAGDIISVTGNATIDSKTSFKESGNKVVLTVDKQKLTINDVKDQPIVVVNGNDTVTFGSLPGGVTYADNKKSLKIASPFTGTVQADDYASSVVTLDGSAATGVITLVGNKKVKVLKGGAGQTTMIGSAAADIFHAGTGADVIYYSDGDGKDIVYDFDATKDVIKLSGATVSVTDFVEKKNDIVLTIGKGSITLKDAPRGTITVEQSGGKLTYKTLPSNVTYKAAKEAVTLAKEFSGTLNAADLGLPVKEVSAAAATGKVHLIGMSTATKLTASKGGSTLVGGKGDDTLIGGAGNDVFVTSGGNDFINKYTAGQDKLQIVGTLKNGKIDGSNVEITTSNGTVTLKGMINKELTLTVNGVDQKYKFTKTNTTLDTALITGNAQFPTTDDYWFLASDDANDEIRSLLNENTTADDAALGSLTMSFEQSAALELTSNVKIKSIRHHKK